jgi:hypothetical protein
MQEMFWWQQRGNKIELDYDEYKKTSGLSRATLSQRALSVNRQYTREGHNFNTTWSIFSFEFGPELYQLRYEQLLRFRQQSITETDSKAMLWTF